jgi:hypothetical protein
MQDDRLCPITPLKCGPSTKVTFSEVTHTATTSSPPTVNSPPPSTPLNHVPSPPIVIRKTRQSHSNKECCNDPHAASHDLPPRRDKNGLCMVRHGRLSTLLYPPVYVPFQTPRPFDPIRDYRAGVWGGLRLDSSSVYTEESVTTQILEAEVRERRAARGLRGSGQRNARRTAGPQMVVEPVAEQEDQRHEPSERERHDSVVQPVNNDHTKSPPPLRHDSRCPSNNVEAPPSHAAEVTVENREDASDEEPPSSLVLESPPPPTFTQIPLKVYRQLLLPLTTILVFLTSPIQRYYTEWNARRGPLGSHSTKTGRWLTKTREWRGFEQYRGGVGVDHGSDCGFGRGRKECELVGCSHGDGSESSSLIGDGRQVGNGERRGSGIGYGTFSERTYRERELREGSVSPRTILPPRAC